MKYIFLFVAIAMLFVIPANMAYSQVNSGSSSSATTAPLNEAEMKNVKKIIDLVASSSAEQKLTEKAGVIGTVAEKTNTTINLTTLNGENRIIDIDEITKFSDQNSKTFGISDIKTGETLGVIGVLNKVSLHILGRFVDRLTSLPTHFEGGITNIDNRNFQYTAVDESGNKMILDIQTTSNIYSFTKGTGEIRAGFSKANIGERVFVSGFPDSTIKNQLEVRRLIFFPNIPLSSAMKKYTAFGSSATPSAKPTSAK